MSKTTGMPKINLSKCNLTPAEMELAKGIVNTKTGELRASKPKVNLLPIGKDKYGRNVMSSDNTGLTAYIWRMVAFSVSPKSEHHCMPVMAEFDLPIEILPNSQDAIFGYSYDHDKRRELGKMCDAIADKIVNSIPKSEWYGVKRWEQAYGMIGTPQYNNEGAVVYR